MLSDGEPKEKSESKKCNEPHPPSLMPYISPLPFPQRNAKTQIDAQFRKFLDVLKKQHVNITFIDALS